MLLDGDAGELTQRQHEYLSIIEASAERLLGITRDLLDLARIESGRLELSLQPTDLLTLLETLVMEQAPQLEGRSQRVVLHAAPGVPLALVDRQRTAQVIGNLISNASKYAAPGTTIDIAVDGDADATGFLQVAVADQGWGAERTGEHGAGLGLYIAKLLVEQHGGQIWLESKPGEGATFYTTFPAAAGMAA
jgi:signal transduction histidine kinase